MARKYCQIFSTGFSSGSARWQQDDGEVLRDFEFAGGVPSGPIHQHNRMGLSGDVAADLVEMHLHGLRVRPRQHERRPLAVSRTDGAEQIGVAIALIGRLAGARALSRPQARQAILLAKACFVLEPDLHRRSRWQVSYMHLERVGEVFLNASMIRLSCLGCCGRALIWAKPSSPSSLDIPRSE